MKIKDKLNQFLGRFYFESVNNNNNEFHYLL
jgi:hypothetical protein